MIEVSHLGKRHADNSENHAFDLKKKNCYSTVKRPHSTKNSFSSTLQNHVHNNERSKDRKLKENGKCTNVTNRRSRVGRRVKYLSQRC